MNVNRIHKGRRLVLCSREEEMCSLPKPSYSFHCWEASGPPEVLQFMSSRARAQQSRNSNIVLKEIL